jgi:hypothetical protein
MLFIISQDCIFLDKIMKKLQKSESLLKGKVNYISEELERLELERLFDHVEILITELQVPQDRRVDLLSLADDGKIISKFEKKNE